MQDEVEQDVGNAGNHGGTDQLIILVILLSSAWVLREAGADPGVVNKDGWADLQVDTRPDTIDQDQQQSMAVLHS